MSTMTRHSSPAHMARRKFDHDDARWRYAEGESIQALADEYGVSYNAVRFVVDDDVYQRARNRWQVWMQRTCEDCGGPCKPNHYQKTSRNDRCICRKCAGIRKREEHLLTRLDAAGDILCGNCGAHLPIDEYRMERGFPLAWCRACETAARRAHRHANAEHYREYERERKRRARAAA